MANADFIVIANLRGKKTKAPIVTLCADELTHTMIVKRVPGNGRIFGLELEWK